MARSLRALLALAAVAGMSTVAAAQETPQKMAEYRLSGIVQGGLVGDELVPISELQAPARSDDAQDLIARIAVAREHLLDSLTRLQQAYRSHGMHEAAAVVRRQIAALRGWSAESLPALPASSSGGLSKSPSAHRGQVGKRIYVQAVGRTNGSVWGSDLYTDDSDVGTAAVHAGILKPGESAILQLVIYPGKPHYAGSERHGVRSRSWESFPGSFWISGKGRELASVGELRGTQEAVVAFVTGRTDRTVWGSDVYTDDSDIGTAAVHAGLLKAGESGFVTVTPVPGLTQYTASTRNGVTTSAYRQWGGSFVLTPYRPVRSEPEVSDRAVSEPAGSDRADSKKKPAAVPALQLRFTR